MTETGTFSALIDDVITTTGRLDRRANIVSYANNTMREIQARQRWFRDLIEDQLTADADPYVWTFPSTFYKMRTVQYDDGAYPTFRRPGASQANQYNSFYYGAADYFVFKGTRVGGLINVAYYAYVPRLIYYAEADRPATYTLEDGWEYLTAATDDEKTTARGLVTNWMLTNWYDTILEGTLTKLYRLVKDQERMTTSYSLYNKGVDNLESMEAHESEGV